SRRRRWAGIERARTTTARPSPTRHPIRRTERARTAGRAGGEGAVGRALESDRAAWEPRGTSARYVLVPVFPVFGFALPFTPTPRLSATPVAYTYGLLISPRP